MATKYLSEEAEAYERWLEEFDKRCESLPTLDLETHEGPMAAAALLTRVTAASYIVCLVSAFVAVADFFWGPGVSTWAINYSGDFMELVPFLVE